MGLVSVSVRAFREVNSPPSMVEGRGPKSFLWCLSLTYPTSYTLNKVRPIVCED